MFQEIFMRVQVKLYDENVMKKAANHYPVCLGRLTHLLREAQSH